MKRMICALLMTLLMADPAVAQSPIVTAVEQAQQDAASAQDAANAANAQAAAAQQAAAEAAARAQQAAANAAAAKSQADLAQIRAAALESQQAAIAAQAAKTEANAALSEARLASAAAAIAAANAQRSAIQSQSAQVTAMAANARAISMAVHQQIEIDGLTAQTARLNDTLMHEREQVALFQMVAALLCMAVLITAAIALMIWRRLRALSVVVVETPVPTQTESVEARLPDRVRVINDPAVIDRLDAMFQDGAA